MSSDWSLRLVVKWCEDRAKQSEDRRLLKWLWAQYEKGSIKTPFERFALAVQSEVDEKTEFWIHMAKTLRDEAANAEVSEVAGGQQKGQSNENKL